MAPPKRLRPAPLDDPPTASSSSDDDQQPPPKKPEDEVVDEEEEASSEEGEEENDQDEDEGSSSEEEEVQPTPPSQPASKNPPPSTPISNPKPESGSESESGSQSGSESGSESDSEPEPTPPPNAKVKPLASKPMKAQPPARSGTKRPSENGSKRANKKTAAGGGSNDDSEADEDGDVKMTGEDSKKMHQRVFTEEDEIAILKGLAEFISKTGKDPMKDPDAFHNFVKKSIHADANSAQLKRKVRGLKLKFKANGSFTKEHDKKAFELSKKVWGNDGGNGVEENGKVNEKTPKSTKKEAPVRNNGSAKKEVVAKKDTGKVESDVDKSLALSEMCSFGEAAGLSSLNMDAMRRGMELLGESKVDEFDAKWKKVQIAELEMFVTRGQLIKDQTRLALEAFKKSIN
ncbi:unnamed protein product [Lathyrus sativus]|nr:unnamed protein product [Lathyrus sativus]